jgi:hypothetical protein
MRSVAAWAGAAAQAGMAGIGVANTSAAMVAVLVTAFIAAVQVAPECIMAAGEAMVEVITAVATAEVITAAVMAAGIRLVHARLA